VNAPERIYVFGADAKMPFWQLTLREFTAQSYDPKTNSWTVCTSIPTGHFDASVAVVNDRLYVIGGFTLEFPTDRFTLNPSYTFSAVNQQYTPFGYETVPPAVAVVSPENKTYAANHVSLAFAVNKPALWMGFSLDGQETVTITGNMTIAELTGGLHNVTIYAKDTFENTGASETVTFTIAKPEPFPTTLVATASGASIAIISVGLLVYFRKRNY
jgi:hypothetical protein